MKIPAVLYVLCILSTLAGAELNPAARSATEEHARLTAPRVSIVVTTNQVQKLEAVVAYEAACLVILTDALEATTGSRSNALQRIRAGDALVTIQAINNATAAANASQRSVIALRWVNASLVLRELDQRGYPTPLPPDFGQLTRTEVTRTPAPRPSIWEERFPNQPPPTVDQVRAQLARRAARAPQE